MAQSRAHDPLLTLGGPKEGGHLPRFTQPGSVALLGRVLTAWCCRLTPRPLSNKISKYGQDGCSPRLAGFAGAEDSLAARAVARLRHDDRHRTDFKRRAAPRRRVFVP